MSAPAMPDAALEVRDLTMSFGGLRAIDDLSLEVNSGEILGIVGPNGAGKSVLINLITGFYAPSSGSIRFYGQELTGLLLHQIGRLGIARTFQNIRIFKRMTVLENVMTANKRYAVAPLRSMLGFASKRRDVAEALGFLELMGLADQADRLAGTLPYGDGRRLEIARALAGRPRLLLLDEPAAGMNERETDDLIADVNKSRELLDAIVLVEHDMALIAELSNRVLAMNYGRRMAEGSAAEVFADPDFVEAYIGSEIDDG